MLSYWIEINILFIICFIILKIYETEKERRWKSHINMMQ